MFERPKCKLTGIDGNVFNVIGTVSRTLKENGQYPESIEFREKAIRCKTYDEVIQLCFDFVDVE